MNVPLILFLSLNKGTAVGTCAFSKCVFCSIKQPVSVSVHCNVFHLLQEYSGYCMNHR